ncbi:formylglycine-generating enzyme family protein [Elizabethkingia sp. JS20170427COW]|uniref:formylglycine-generating enzyme family protein n=1 Tax=Elizabethkingia sp. JS20170427COW TaxID=2583851 RepID=UPI0011102C8C|nr:formylglycine-generating enzyme family protein [Elizabethkingia sp. JS20170427COW]QCX52380.1 formylglycine-generating enzyme family protein [Elizabethkingia sp. JS20170427COW]
MKSFCFAILMFMLFSCQKENHQETSSTFSKEVVAVKDHKKMVKIEGGSYKAFIGKGITDSLVPVAAFYMDETAVTNAEFLTFLKANPQWTKSKVLKLYADSTYLHNWKGDYELPSDVSPNAPVTNISWFAAKAYAESVGKRLPTVDEWEYVARADEKVKDATNDPNFTSKIIKLYQNRGAYKKPVKQFKPNVWGLYDIYGVIWEWTSDFNSIMMSGESRNDSQPDESLFCAGAALTASDLRDYAAFMRFALRGSIDANYTINNLGFRCAKDL